ncbi:hypothetical protein CDI09_13390 [Komagataeibacter nataicola]|nr:hypothetical protein CDI09_13390 [Komagataeibacter nataicola]
MGVCATASQTSGSKGGRPTEAYYLNRKQAIFITAKSETAIATDITIEIVERFDAYERDAAPAIKAPANMVEALTLALEQQKTLEAKDQEIAELAPKAAGLEILAEKDGELGIRDVGRELKVGQNRVRDMLFERKWACRQGRDIRPASYGLEHGYVRLVPRLYEDKQTGQEKISDDFRITRKGIARLAEIFGVMKAGCVPFFAKAKEPAQV